MFPPQSHSINSNDVKLAAPALPSVDRKLKLSPLLELPYKTVNDVWSIYGKRGSGKSYFLGRVCEELSRINVPFLIIDVKNAHALIELPGLAHVHMDSTNPRSAIERLGNHESIILSMKSRSLDEMRVWVTEFCNAMSGVNFGPRYKTPVMVAIEECHNFIGQGQGTAGGDSELRSQCTAAVDKLIREGRQDGVGILLISQSVANVMSNARRQCEIKIIFNVKDSTDIKQLRTTLIGKSNREVDAIIDRVYNFTVGEFICVAPTYIGGPGVIVDKTMERTTKHAGRSFVEEGGETQGGDIASLGGGMDTFTFDPQVAVAADSPSDANYEPQETKTETFGAMPSAAKPHIDYKSALSISLLVLSILGVGAVVLKQYMSMKGTEKEQEIEARLKDDRRRIEALKQQVDQKPKAANLGDSMPMDLPDKEINRTPGDISAEDPFNAGPL